MTPRPPGFAPRSAEDERLLAHVDLALDIAIMIGEQLHQQGMKQKQLAQRMNCSQAFVSQLLSGKTNMTLATLADVARALGQRVRVRFEARAQVQPAARFVVWRRGPRARFCPPVHWKSSSEVALSGGQLGVA